MTMRRLWLVGLALCLAAPAWAEKQLGGIRLGDSPLNLMQSRIYGPPDGMYTSGGVFNKLSLQAMQEVTDPIPWAFAVRTEMLQPNQVEWVYNRPPLSVGVVITGLGVEATITNVIFSMWQTDRPSNEVRTERGVRLGSTFREVVTGYGFPGMLTVLQETPVAGGGLSPLGQPGAPAAGVFGFSFMGRSRNGGSPGALPPVSGGEAVAPPGAYSPTATLYIGGAPITFTKHMVLDYPGTEFTLYGMRVMRIHIYG